MTPEIESLARRAVACPRWRWMPGMACQWNHPRSGAGGQQVMPTWARVVDLPAGPLPLTYCLVDVGSIYRGALPDLTDPATLGCLLALVREAWHEATTQIDSGTWWVAARDGTPLGAGATEAAALVSALEAAPTIQESRTVQEALAEESATEKSSVTEIRSNLDDEAAP